MRFAVALTLVFLAGVMLAGAARAQSGSHLFCEEDRPGDEELAELTHRAPPPAAILPCALVDSGVLDDPRMAAAGSGAACADTPFYVVTHAGVLLCQVDVELFAATGAPAVERAPSALPAQSIALHAATTATPTDLLAPPAPRELTVAAATVLVGGPRDANSWRPPRPS